MSDNFPSCSINFTVAADEVTWCVLSSRNEYVVTWYDQEEGVPRREGAVHEFVGSEEKVFWCVVEREGRIGVVL